MASKYNNEAYNPPEDLVALAGMFDINWTYVQGYGARTWELTVVRPQSTDSMSRRTQSTQYDDWIKILDELIAFRDAS